MNFAVSICAAKAHRDNMQTFQLYAFWTLISVGILGLGLAILVM
jgi:hypothetical protein